MSTRLALSATGIQCGRMTACPPSSLLIWTTPFMSAIVSNDSPALSFTRAVMPSIVPMFERSIFMTPRLSLIMSSQSLPPLL